MRTRPVRGLALVAAVLAVAGGGASAALASSPSHHSGSLGPLARVGSGWSVAEYSAASAPLAPHHFSGKTTLYLVSPQGRKFAFYSWPASATGPARQFFLVDWSGDGQRVLVANFFNKFEQINVATGKVINTFKLPASAAVIGYTRPSGLNVLAKVNGSIRRYDLTGKLTKILAHAFNSAIEPPAGTSVIVSTGSGIEQVSNGGGVIKRLHAPVAVFGCDPVRWWNATTVLADCDTKGSAAPRLWLFPMSGGRVIALTAQRNGHGPDLGDIDAWKLTSGVYLQALGPCGVEFIATQARNGAAHQVLIPGVHSPSDHIVTGLGSSLLVQPNSGCAGQASLVWFNPHTKKVTWIFATPKNVAGVEVAVPFGRPTS